MTAELTRDEVLVDAVVAVLAIASWAVGSYNVDAAFAVDPTWAVTGFVVATAQLVFRVSTETGRRVHAFLDESVLARIVVLIVGLLLVFAVVSALDAYGVDVAAGPGVYSFFLGLAAFVVLEAAVYLRG